ncbi:hypothetical protein sS8_5266 [Methylocaldum marinum]|uniref:Uncharacterized protein n=1 Tax=Methylocaldum marinum TaxID=1432792 RepID=A0A250KZT3_9GAMM|nr:hypothetical protein sS8_5266 [Methylocaldum marinum]
MKALSEKHMVVVTALVLGLIIFWLIATDPRTAKTSLSTPSAVATENSLDNDVDLIATATSEQSSD